VTGSRANVNTMQLETKFLHLRTPVTIGSRFGDWEVTWLGGWTRDRLSYLVMVVRIEQRSASMHGNGQSRDHCSGLQKCD
jgi:hypothetical protein